MKLGATILLTGLTLVVGGAARAQDAGDLAGAIAAAGEGVGQSLGQSLADARTVFVTATGRAPLSTPLPDAYQVDVETNAPTAVEAAAQRDAIVAKLMAVARTYGAPANEIEQSISLGGAQGAGMPFPIPIPGAKPANATEGEATPKPQFAAKATLRFGEPRSGSAPDFLDALHQGGADTITSGQTQGSFLTRVFAGSSAGPPPEPDASVWDVAMASAMRTARAEATTLAATTGQSLAEARQILLVWRSFNDREATVTVAVRFGLAQSK